MIRVPPYVQLSVRAYGLEDWAAALPDLVAGLASDWSLTIGDPMDRARSLAARTGLDATAVWEWGAVERMSTALLCLHDGMEDEGRAMLAAAERCAEF